MWVSWGHQTHTYRLVLALGQSPPPVCKVINTLKHRAKTVCSNYHLLKEEEDHLNKALGRCKYPTWALNRVHIKQNKNRTKQGTSKNKNNTGNNKPYIVGPYMQGMSES